MASRSLSCASQPQSLAGLQLRLTAHSATAAYSNLCDGRSTPASGRLSHCSAINASLQGCTENVLHLRRRRRVELTLYSEIDAQRAALVASASRLQSLREQNCIPSFDCIQFTFLFFFELKKANLLLSCIFTSLATSAKFC